VLLVVVLIEAWGSLPGKSAARSFWGLIFTSVEVGFNEKSALVISNALFF